MKAKSNLLFFNEVSAELASLADPNQRDQFDGGGGDGYDGVMETRVAKLEADLSTIKVDVATILSNYSTKSDIESVRVDIHKSTGDTHKWMIATVMGLFIGFGGLFLAMSNALKPSSAPAQPQPIIISVPAVAPSQSEK